jgi:bifunctional oligoribonuclease and PAP phosphatase NrnA
MNTTYERAIEALKSGKRILITTHVNPDGDAMGSALGLYHALISMGKTAQVLLPSPYPSNLAWLPGASKAVVWKDSHANHRLLSESDTIAVLDLNSLERLGSLGKAIDRTAGVVIVNIDHHPFPQPFASIACIDPAAPATASMLAEMIDDDHMTSQTATCLYTGIMTDTGSFRFPKTSAVLFREAGRLVDAGADPVECYERTMNVNSPQRMLLLGSALKGLQLFAKGRLCVMSVRKRDLKAAEAVIDDTEGFVHHTMSIMGVEMGVLIIEHESEVKVSFRSKGAVHVRKLAEHFGGGGHDHAAGARISRQPYSHVVEQVIARSIKALP